MRNAIRLILSLFCGATTIQTILSFCGVSFPDHWLSCISGAVVFGVVVFCLNGFYLEGYLLKSASIPVKALGMEVNVRRGDIFEQDGVVVIGANDFFDTVVDDSHISPQSLHGQMIKKFWGGNVHALDCEIEQQLRGIKYESETRDGVAKEHRYPIGTSIFVADSYGHRFIMVALSRTDAKTHRVQSLFKDLPVAIHGALSLARERANGDPVSFPLMGSMNARIKAPEQALFNELLTTIMSECLENNKVSKQINIVLSKNSLKDLNMFQLQKEWNV